MKIKHLIIFPSFFLLTCGKIMPVIVEGDVTEEHYGGPVKNAKISVTEAFHHNQDPEIGSTTTDENGHYKISFRMRGPSYSYKFKVHSLGVNRSVNPDFETGITKTNKNLQIQIMPKTLVRFFVKNNSPSDQRVITPNSDKVFTAMTEGFMNGLAVINGFGETHYDWSYSGTVYPSSSILMSGTINITSKTDTVLETLIITGK